MPTTKMYEILNSLNPEIMKDIFKTSYCNTLNALIFSKRNFEIVKYRL